MKLACPFRKETPRGKCLTNNWREGGGLTQSINLWWGAHRHLCGLSAVSTLCPAHVHATEKQTFVWSNYFSVQLHVTSCLNWRIQGFRVHVVPEWKIDSGIQRSCCSRMKKLIQGFRDSGIQNIPEWTPMIQGFRDSGFRFRDSEFRVQGFRDSGNNSWRRERVARHGIK